MLIVIVIVNIIVYIVIIVFMKIVCIIVFLRIVRMCNGFSMHIVAFLVLKRVMCMHEISVIFAAMLFNMIINVIDF